MGKLKTLTKLKLIGILGVFLLMKFQYNWTTENALYSAAAVVVLYYVLKNWKWFKKTFFSGSKEPSRHIPDSVKKEVLGRQGGTCAMCGESKFLQYHHKKKFSEGGTNDAQNIVALCPNHHSLAHAQHAEVNYKRSI